MFRPIDVGAGVVGPAVGGLHDARPAAGHDRRTRGLPLCAAVWATRRANSPGDLVVAALGQEPLGLGDGPLPPRGRRAPRPAAPGPRPAAAAASAGSTIRVLPKTTIVEWMFALLEGQLRLEELQLHPRRPHPRAGEELDVLVGQPIAGRVGAWLAGSLVVVRIRSWIGSKGTGQLSASRSDGHHIAAEELMSPRSPERKPATSRRRQPHK